MLGTGPGDRHQRPGRRRQGGRPATSSAPPFQQIAAGSSFRHMQRFLPDDEDHQFEDLRTPARGRPTPPTATSSKNTTSGCFDIGMDQETLAYRSGRRTTGPPDVWTEANLQNWVHRDAVASPGRLLPAGRLAPSTTWFTYFKHSGVDYATIHTDIMVNNPEPLRVHAV